MDENNNLKIGDLGMSRVFSDEPGKERPNRLGTLPFSAPECFNNKKEVGLEGLKVDIWSAGCVSAELMLGRHLFVRPKDKNLTEDEVT